MKASFIQSRISIIVSFVTADIVHTETLLNAGLVFFEEFFTVLFFDLIHNKKTQWLNFGGYLCDNWSTEWVHFAQTVEY